MVKTISLEAASKELGQEENAWQEFFSVMDEVQAQNPCFTEEEVHLDIEEAIQAVRGRTA